MWIESTGSETSLWDAWADSSLMCMDLRTWRTDWHLSDIVNGLEVNILRIQSSDITAVHFRAYFQQ